MSKPNPEPATVIVNTCFICGEEADTEEHLFPKWLQNKYNLWNQKINLPNDTGITYKHLKIPCCAECNNVRLSGIETRIKDDTADDVDLWQWGAKIHYGLLKKHDFLEWDRRNPGYKIGDVIKPDDPMELDRHLIHSIHGEFSTHPSPFGSVYRFKFEQEEIYHFAHIIQPGALCICLGNRGYVIFIRDTGTLLRQPGIQELFEKHRLQANLGKMLNFFANAWVHLYRYKATIPIVMSSRQIAVVGRAKLIEELPFPNDMFLELWRYVTANPENTITNPIEGS